MENIKSIDRQTAKAISARMGQLVAQLESEFNVKVKMGGGRFSDTSYTGKVEVSIVSDGGVVESKERTDYKRACIIFDLKKEWLDKEFISNGKRFKVTGLKTSAKKYPVIGTEIVTGKSYKFPAHTIKMRMGE